MSFQVPFFNDDETAAASPKADALFIPRENPRSLIIHPIEQWPFRSNTEKKSMSKDSTANGNGKGNYFASFGLYMVLERGYFLRYFTISCTI